MASITCSSDQRLSTSKRRLKPLTLKDYLLDDLSSCSSNGFKSFPRRQPPSSSSTVRRLLDAEIKRSGLIHHRQNKPRLTRRSRTTCGTAISHAVHKASTAFINAVKLIPFHSAVTSRKGDQKQEGVFSRSFSKRLLSKRFWRKPVGHSRREVTVELGDGEIQWWISAAFFPGEESLDQPSDLVSQISTVPGEAATFSASEAAAIITTDKLISGSDSSSSGSEFFTNSSSSETVQSSSSSVSSTTSSGEAEEVSTGNDAVVESGESLNARDCDGSSVNGNSMCNREESVNEEKEQLSPVSILECPFQDDEDDDEDDAITDHISNQNDTYEKIGRKSRRVNGFVRIEPLDLEKRIEKYVETEEDGYSYQTQETEEDESESRADRLFALVKSRIGETNKILASNVADNLLLDYLQKDNIGPKEEALMVKKVEDWVMDRQDEMFMSWEVREMRQVYLKEMKWGCINEDERECVIEDLVNGFFTFLVDEFIFDLA
ncbi:Uncharacterized protein Rs2_35604 [Raphanus sativus]|uniref:Uncharacterized protein LOC108840299 n=1 Tax=Raphanus sativus TaxID=3726 RepID=A0A6J0M808_RAPSA|nr:uncharacterized protein LOC108840299 [Raphanus sativus]KAJ4885511.1 Uncharacterized protein Rs2_35604 [Raphanus sativus]